MKATTPFLLVFLTATAVAQTPPNNPDVRIFVTSDQQLNPRMAVSLSDGNPLMLVMNSGSWYFSTNSGLAWFGSEIAPPGFTDQIGGTVCSFGMNDRAYYVTLGPPGGIFVASTTDFGTSWSPQTNADPLSSTSDDAEHVSGDPSGTHPDNLYAAWTDFNVSGSPIVCTRSTNRGQTWGARTILAIGSNRGQGVHIAIGPGGEAYVLWAHYGPGTQETGMGFARSTDGGNTFSTPVVAYSFDGIRISNGGIGALNNTRATSYPDADVDRSQGSRRGWIYVVHPELAGGQADIFLHRSTDGGATWSSGIQVNGPDVQPGKWQWMPSIAVDAATGDVTVSYNSMDSTGANDMTNRYAAHSTDGGDTWERWVISDVRFLWSLLGTPQSPIDPSTRTSTIATNGLAWSVWTDARTGQSQAWIERTEYNRPDTSMTIISPNGGEVWHPGETHPLIWRESGIDTVTIAFSFMGSGGPWQILQSSLSGRDTIPFGVPGVSSSNCFIRVSWRSHPAVSDTNDAPFTIVSSTGIHWVAQTSGTALDLYSVVALSPSVAWAAGAFGVVRRTTNGGNTWISAGTLGADIYALAALDANTALAAISPLGAAVYKTTSAGQIWTQTDTVSPLSAFVDAIEMNSPTTGFSLGDPLAGRWLLRQTTNAGNTWFDGPSILCTPSQAVAPNCLMWYDSLDGWFSVSPGVVFRTTNGGSAWTGITTPSPPGPVWFTQPALGLSGPGLRSTDGGASWTQTQGTIPGMVTGLSGSRGSRQFWATAGSNVYYSADAGDSWSTSPPFGYVGITFLTDISMTQLGNVTAGWVVGMSGTIVHFIVGGDDVEEHRNEIPTGLSLSQNYPNPFNPTTRIRYTIPSGTQGRASLRVYDVLGREVATLLDGLKSPGSYEVIFDASLLASGIYFYRLTAGGLSQTRKLLLIR